MKQLVCLILLVSTILLPAKGDENNKFAPLEGLPFVYVSSSPDAALPVVTDSLFNASAQGVSFVVNRSDLRATEPFVSIFKNRVLPLLRGKGLVLRKIEVRGAASPDGPYANNCRLGRERTNRLLDFICSQLGCSADSMQIDSRFICEDYGYLVYLMEKSADPDAARVRKIWTDCNGDEEACKRKLMALDNRTAWQRYAQQYFPKLRQSRVMMWFGYPVKKVEPVKADTVVPATPVVPPVVVDSVPPVTADTVAPQVCEKRLPLIAIRTNLLHDFFYMPNFGWAPGGNIQLEYFPLNGHYTYNIGFTFINHRHWREFKFCQVRDLQLELRRYFKRGLPYRGAYLGAYAHGFMYGVGFNEKKGWEGEGFGAGVSAGYTLKLVRSGHLRLEFMVAAGFLYTMYDPYIYGNPLTGQYDGKYYYDYTGKIRDFKKRDHNRTWVGPTNLGIQLTYDLIYRKKGGKR